jgi:hypothetical protein
MNKQTFIDETFRHTLHKQIIKLCHSFDLPLHWNHYGPRKYTNYQCVGLIVLFLRSKKSLRDFVDEFKESRWSSWLGLKSPPQRSTLHDWLRMFDMKFLRLLHSLLLENEKPSLMAIDATGIDSWQRSRHYEKRMLEMDPKLERNKKMPYAKLDALVDVDNGIIHDFVLRMKPRHDTIGAKTMFKRMKQKFVKILADKGYDSEPLHRIVRKMGNILYAKLRKMKRGNPGGKFRRKCVIKDPDYNRRCRVESVFNSIKHRRINALRSKLSDMKKREVTWHIIIYNLEIIQRINKFILWLLKKPFRTSLWGRKIFKLPFLKKSL